MMIAPKLQPNDKAMVVSPSRSLAILSELVVSLARERLAELGLKVDFSANAGFPVQIGLEYLERRVADLHDAFSDPTVKLVISSIGGFNANQILPYLDYELIGMNPKIICGYSDLTALLNAVYARTGLVTYYGPHFSTFGQVLGLDYTVAHFRSCLFGSEPIDVEPSSHWSNDAWYENQSARRFVENPGFEVICTGRASGVCLGGNLRTFLALAGTPYFPDLSDSVVFLEEEAAECRLRLARHMAQFCQLPNFERVRALVFGRFEVSSGVTAQDIRDIVSTNIHLQTIPVIINADFGHTDPKITLPIGGQVKVSADCHGVTLQISQH